MATQTFGNDIKNGSFRDDRGSFRDPGLLNAVHLQRASQPPTGFKEIHATNLQAVGFHVRGMSSSDALCPLDFMGSVVKAVGNLY